MQYGIFRNDIYVPIDKKVGLPTLLRHLWTVFNLPGQIVYLWINKRKVVTAVKNIKKKVQDCHPTVGYLTTSNQIQQ